MRANWIKFSSVHCGLRSRCLALSHKRSDNITLAQKLPFSTETRSSSLSHEETKKFSDLAGGWWEVNGKMMALHSMNEVRVLFIRDCFIYQGYMGTKPFTAEPMKGIEILEVGCGGGILSEPLARLGANVLGIDSSEEAIEVAKQHRGTQKLELQYMNALVEDIASVGSLKFDAVIASEVLEHVEKQSDFISSCSAVLKPGGSLIISTINRTLLSYILVITAAEKLLKVAPDGAHNWNKFVTVAELTEYLSLSNCHLRKLHGLILNPLCNKWSFMASTEMNYIVHAVKGD